MAIYRLAGVESETRELLEKFLEDKGPTPDLSKYGIHAVTSCVKKFLKSLKEAVIPLSVWQFFIDAADCPAETIEGTWSISSLDLFTF